VQIFHFGKDVTMKRGIEQSKKDRSGMKCLYLLMMGCKKSSSVQAHMKYDDLKQG
jgi:hypothetical protein